ncbi:MAG: sugar phosphate isomerase/epimerase [Planctomycetia bacterium]|nr:sugar phosphate isomerase/epimerase [Planctomycetia bacterium]
MPRINAVSFHENPSIEAICRLVRSCGFDALEVSRPPFYRKLITRATRQRFLEWAREIGLNLYGFDCWVEVDPYERRQETLDEFQHAVDWAADLNLGMLITHDPWASTNGTRSASQCLAAAVGLFRDVARMCAAAGLRLVFEPHPDTLSMDNAWAIEFIDAVAEGHDAGGVGILYDCCHYGVGQPNGYARSIEVLGNRIGHVHLSDGDGTTYALHLPLGEGSLDLEGMVAALKAIHFQGTLTNDLYNYPLLEEGARRNAARVREVEDCLGLARV